MSTAPVIVSTNAQDDYVEVFWTPPVDFFSEYRIYRQVGGAWTLVTTLPFAFDHYRFTVPVNERGITVTLGVVAFDGTSESEFAIAHVHSYPNPPSNLTVVYAADHRVDLVWTNPPYNEGIQGFVVERAGQNGVFSKIAIAGVNRYSDIGNQHVDPSSGKQYSYRISTITFAGLCSTTILTSIVVAVLTRTDARSMIGKSVLVPPGKYRIKAVSDNNQTESQWVILRKLLFFSEKAPYEHQFKITTVTVDKGMSPPVKTKTLLIPDNGQTRFRIRCVDVNGTESVAMIADLNPNLWTVPIIIDNQDTPVISGSQKTMTSRRV